MKGVGDFDKYYEDDEKRVWRTINKKDDFVDVVDVVDVVDDGDDGDDDGGEGV